MNKPVNTWRGVHAELLRRLNAREWLPGEAVPNEADLAAEFGCARATVNRAMRELAEAGMVERRRKAGTRVAQNPRSRVVLDIPIIRQEVEQRNARWRQSLIGREFCCPPARIAGRLGLGGDRKLLHVRNLHFADSHPFLLEDRWINADLLPEVLAADFTEQSPNEWLIRNAPYSSGEIAFSAIGADAALADLLEAEEGAAIFTIDRVTWNGDDPVTSVRLSYAPGYRMTSRL